MRTDEVGRPTGIVPPKRSIPIATRQPAEDVAVSVSAATALSSAQPPETVLAPTPLSASGIVGPEAVSPLLRQVEVLSEPAPVYEPQPAPGELQSEHNLRLALSFDEAAPAAAEAAANRLPRVYRLTLFGSMQLDVLA